MNKTTYTGYGGKEYDTHRSFFPVSFYTEQKKARDRSASLHKYPLLPDKR